MKEAKQGLILSWVVFIGIIIVLVALVLWEAPGEKEYNKHVCNTYGLDENCK